MAPISTFLILLIEWLPFFIAFQIFHKYKTVSFSLPLSFVFLAVAPFQFFFTYDYFSLNIIIQLSLLAILSFISLKKKNSSRDYYIYFFLVYAFIFINNIWNITLYLHINHLFFPTLNEVFSIKGNISSLFYLNNPITEIGDFGSVIYKDFIILKLSMVIFFTISWGFLYKIVNFAHNHKIAFNHINPSKFNFSDLFFFVFSLLLIGFQAYVRTGNHYLFFGIFLLYFIHAVLLFALLYFVVGLYCEIKQKPFNLLTLFTISNLLIGGHAFEYLNDILMKNPSIYLFAEHGTPSFGTALSLTYFSFFLIPIFLMFFLYFFLKKKQFTINYLVGTISFLSFIGVIFVSHETIISHVVNKTDEIYDSYITETLRDSNFQFNGKIKVGDFNQFKEDLLQCKVCKINPIKSIPFDEIESELSILSKNNLYQQLNGKRYNLKLIYFGLHQNNKIVYVLNQGNHITFVTLGLYSLFYFVIFIFWFSFIIFINKLHSKKLKPLLT